MRCGRKARAPCSCGANPPGPAAEPRTAAVRQCARRPAAVLEFTVPYYENYTKLVEYNGAARDVPTVKPEEVDEVRIGFLGPVENHPRPGARQDDARTARSWPSTRPTPRGGYGGKPFKLMIHNDQAHLGSIQQRNRQDGLRRQGLGHAGLDQRRFHAHRAARFAEGRSAHRQQRGHRPHHSRRPSFPWYSHHHPGRPRAGLHAGAAHLYRSGPASGSRCCASTTATAASACSSSRTPRAGWAIPWSSSRSTCPATRISGASCGSSGFGRGRHRALGRCGAGRRHPEADARDGDEAARVRQLPRAGRRPAAHRRRCGRRAGDCVSRSIPRATIRPGWLSTNASRSASASSPEVFASLAYDTMNILLDAICRAGLNRGAHPRRALPAWSATRASPARWSSIPTARTSRRCTWRRSTTARYTFRRYPMQMPYAKVGEDGVQYNGPPVADLPAGRMRIGIFGPDAEQLAARFAAARTLQGPLPSSACLRMCRGARLQDWSS